MTGIGRCRCRTLVHFQVDGRRGSCRITDDHRLPVLWRCGLASSVTYVRRLSTKATDVWHIDRLALRGDGMGQAPMPPPFP